MKELLISSLLGIGVLALDVLNLRKLIYPVILLAMAGLVVSGILDWNAAEDPFNNHMLVFDNYALAFIGAFAVILAAWFVLTTDHFGTDARRTDLYALVCFTFAGAVILVSYSNLVMLFLGIEILSIPLYVLAASKKGDILSNEAGFKYFFLGSVASAILLFGIALVYGATGTFDIAGIRDQVATMDTLPGILMAGILMILVGFAFKVSVAPFHFWAPDVYQGSPTVITALMATLVKGAAFAALFRLFAMASFAEALGAMGIVIAILSGVTLIVANTVAAVQSNVKRLLAYSSISHAGFLFATLLIPGADADALFFYVLAYSIASLTSFAILHHVSKFHAGDDMDAFKGLAKRNPVLAVSMTLALLSMAGIPPLSGFLAKYFVISGVLEGGYLWLVILMILTSVIAVYYYLRLIVAMFTPIENAGRIVVGDTQRWMYILLSVLMFALFFGAGWIDKIL